eukprot:84259-Rhodomonas_salina.3
MAQLEPHMVQNAAINGGKPAPGGRRGGGGRGHRQLFLARHCSSTLCRVSPGDGVAPYAALVPATA